VTIVTTQLALLGVVIMTGTLEVLLLNSVMIITPILGTILLKMMVLAMDLVVTVVHLLPHRVMYTIAMIGGLRHRVTGTLAVLAPTLRLQEADPERPLARLQEDVKTSTEHRLLVITVVLLLTSVDAQVHHRTANFLNILEDQAAQARDTVAVPEALPFDTTLVRHMTTTRTPHLSWAMAIRTALRTRVLLVLLEAMHLKGIILLATGVMRQRSLMATAVPDCPPTKSLDDLVVLHLRILI